MLFTISFLILVKSGHLRTSVIESLAARFRAKWVFDYSHPSIPEITTDASLAHHGLLSSVTAMFLRDVDLASVPAEHLASLAACVTADVVIWNISNTDLTSILDSSKCGGLYIRNQSLSTKETLALVRAMENMEMVALGEYMEEVTLDISSLVTYDGRGKCENVRFWNNAAERYREQVRRWAQRISWKVTCDNSNVIIIRGFMN